jgi:glycosyltransferase involved in cell wall biosynthesis
MNVVVISQNYPPDLGAASFRMRALVKALHERGHQVYVIAGMPNRYDDFMQDRAVPEHELSEGVEIFRVKIKTVGNTKIQRIRGFLEYYFGAVKLGMRLKGKGIHVVVATTPQLLQARVGEVLARQLNARLLLDVRDLWPETPIALGELSPNSPVAHVLSFLERGAYKCADHVVTTSPGYIDHIEKMTREDTEISVVLNGIDSEFRKCSQTVRYDRDTVKVIYAGNVGYCQNLITLVEAASMLKDEDFQFTIIGSGTQIEQVRQRTAELGLNNLLISAPIRRADLLTAYDDADVVYLQLFFSDYFRRVIPSKIFEYLALSKPIIYGLDGVSADILSKFPATYRVRPDDPGSLADTLRIVSRELRNGLTVYRDSASLREYTREYQTTKFVQAIENLVTSQEA